VVAAPALKRAGWIAAAALAAAAIFALATHGQRPDPGLAVFAPAGVMASVPPERVTAVVVSRGTGRRELTRDGGRGWSAAPALAAGTDASARVESGLRFLHASAALRVMARGELSGTPLTEIGLDPPRYVVAVRGGEGAPVTIEFGALNPQGLAQYARVAGRDEILLLPSYVGDPWAALAPDP
jgi:hypothetical protein